MPKKKELARDMWDTHVRVPASDKKILTTLAAKDRRSIANLIAIYIRRGIEADLAAHQNAGQS